MEDAFAIGRAVRGELEERANALRAAPERRSENGSGSLVDGYCSVWEVAVQTVKREDHALGIAGFRELQFVDRAATAVAEARIAAAVHRRAVNRTMLIDRHAGFGQNPARATRKRVE